MYNPDPSLTLLPV